MMNGRALLPLLSSLALAGCTVAPQSGGPTTPPPAPGPTAPPPGGPVVAAEVTGHWTGDWGDLYLRPEADGTVRGVYPHDTGSVVGRIEAGVFRGWWCEAPSRQPTADAGDVELTFMRGEGGLAVDGRWRYGTDGAWHDDWDLHWVETPVDAALVARLDDPAQFCAHP